MRVNNSFDETILFLWIIIALFIVFELFMGIRGVIYSDAPGCRQNIFSGTGGCMGTSAIRNLDINPECSDSVLIGNINYTKKDGIDVSNYHNIEIIKNESEYTVIELSGNLRITIHQKTLFLQLTVQ
jgi:hypothetical protein